LTGTSPMEWINAQNFSVQWDWYVQAPYRSTFYFSLESEWWVELYVAWRRAFSNKMFSSTYDSRERSNALLQETIKIKNDPTKNNFNKRTSEGIAMSAWDKYIIRIKYYHSVHDFLDEDIRTYIKLTWHTDELEEEVVPSKFLFTENQYPPFRVSWISPDVAVVRKLWENDLAFKDSTRFILQDIPSEYRWSPSLKLSSSYKLKTLEFSTNIPINVFIARISHYPRPFPWDFENLN